MNMKKLEESGNADIDSCQSKSENLGNEVHECTEKVVVSHDNFLSAFMYLIDS